MAYVSQELKSKLSPQIKAICKKYGVKASLAVRNHSTLVLNVKSGKIDFIRDYGNSDDARKFGIQVNEVRIPAVEYVVNAQGEVVLALSGLPLVYQPQVGTHIRRIPERVSVAVNRHNGLYRSSGYILYRYSALW